MNREQQDEDLDALDHARQRMALGTGDICVSLSGGADSTATYLHLLETGFLGEWAQAGGQVRCMTMDTGWELPETYAYLDTLERRFGKIHRVATWVPGPGEAPPTGYDYLEPVWKTPGKVMDADRWEMAKLLEERLGHYSPMVRLILQWGKVPTSVRKWCTADLKMRGSTGFLATLNDPVSVIGIRAEESAKRAKQPQWEWAPDFDSYVWRPIKWWTRQDRIDIHARHGLAPNPLYLQGEGAGRVGCAPCVNSGKEDLRWLARYHPEAIAVLAQLEEMLASLPTAISLKSGAEAQWFHMKKQGVTVTVPVAEAVQHANTTRGGRQQMMFLPPKDEGCSAWGLCEAAHHTVVPPKGAT